MRKEEIKQFLINLTGILTIIFLIGGCTNLDNNNNDAPLDTINNNNNNIEDVVDNIDDAISSENNKGRLVLSITDKPVQMESINSIKMTTDNVEVQSENKGWIMLEDEEQTYDLLELNANNISKLMADIEINATNITQIRFNVDEVIVVDSEGQKRAKLPSNMLRVNINSQVKNNETTLIEFDVIADESLHITGNGKYIMAPVLQIQARNGAQVDVSLDDIVTFRGGKVNAKQKIGMDIEGNVGANVRIPPQTNLDIDSQNSIVLN